MKTIYNFEMHAPPHLTEAMLQARIEARKKHLQTLLVLLSGVLMQVAIVLLGALAAPRSPCFFVHMPCLCPHIHRRRAASSP